MKERFRKKLRQTLKNKMMLGALTMGDLYRISLLEGEFTFGKHWLPIGGTRRRNREIHFWMEDESWVDFKIPVDAVVKVVGKTVRAVLYGNNIRSSTRVIQNEIEVVIRLDRDPFLD